MAGLNLERVVGNAVHLLGEVIKVRSLPKKPGIGVTDAPKVGRPARSLDFSRSGEGREARGSASALPRPAEVSPWSSWPVATLAHAIDGARHRLFGSGNRTEPEVESWVMHNEVPAAEGHPQKLSGSCGLCLHYESLGRAPVTPQMVEVCPSCGSGGGRHARDCDLVLARDFGIRDDDWVDLPGQVRFEEWADANERRGFLP